MSVYAIADLHLALGVEKSMDIFPGWENYMERLEANWRSVVTDRDTVVVAGDISWALKPCDAAADLAFLDALPGSKLLFKGNHDLWWQTMKKNNELLETLGLRTIRLLYNDAVRCESLAIGGTRGWMFDEAGCDAKVLLREAGRLDRSLTAARALGGEPVAFLHYPPVCGCRECEELLDVLVRHGVTRCYYGHLHGAAIDAAYQGPLHGIDFRLISGDALRFMPMLVTQHETA